MYKHHAYSYIYFLFAQNLSAFSGCKALLSTGDYQPGDISHALSGLFSKFLMLFFYCLSLEEYFGTQEVKGVNLNRIF